MHLLLLRALPVGVVGAVARAGRSFLRGEVILSRAGCVGAFVKLHRVENGLLVRSVTSVSRRTCFQDVWIIGGP